MRDQIKCELQYFYANESTSNILLIEVSRSLCILILLIYKKEKLTSCTEIQRITATSQNHVRKFVNCCFPPIVSLMAKPSPLTDNTESEPITEQINIYTKILERPKRGAT